MEYPCHRCDAPVEDGVLFCKKCGAPQVRVAGTEASPPPLPELEQPDVRTGLGKTSEIAGSVVRWPTALGAAAVAGLIAAALIIPLFGLGLGMLSGGFLSVVFYRRRTSGAPVTSGVAAKLGALSALLELGFVVVFICLRVWLFHNGSQLRAAFMSALERAARFADPEAAPQLIAAMASPAGLTAFTLILLIGLLVCASLGGVIGTLLQRKKDRSP
jgi:hypothetical protein